MYFKTYKTYRRNNKISTTFNCNLRFTYSCVVFKKHEKIIRLPNNFEHRLFIHTYIYTLYVYYYIPFYFNCTLCHSYIMDKVYFRWTSYKN